MNALKLINPDIPGLSPEDTAGRALGYMEAFKADWLPVIDNGHFNGLVNERTLLAVDDEMLLSELIPQKQDAHTKESSHFLEVIKTLVAQDVTLVAVLDPTGLYLGSVSQREIFDFLSHLSFIGSPGGILVLSVKQGNYSLNEISRISESNDIRILASFVADAPGDTGDLWVTVKFNRTDLARLIASYERFGYHIHAQYHESSFVGIDKDRLDLLLRYLNI